jgi:hypothetical protein
VAAGRGIWLTRRAITLHVVIIVTVPTFAALCDWQVHRALGGNSLSWAYVFEWPFFAGYAIYMWWRFIHEAPPEPTPATQPRASTASASGPAAAPEPRDAGDDSTPDADAEERAAYNAYLAELAARDKPKQWR